MDSKGTKVSQAQQDHEDLQGREEQLGGREMLDNLVHLAQLV